MTDAVVDINNLPRSGETVCPTFTVNEAGLKNDEEMKLQEIVIDFSMTENQEQEAVFRIVGEHVLKGDKEQLLMYLAGIGGAGKTHVVNAIRKLFNDLQCDLELKLSAPTGCAAVLIHGHTIHALTLLGGRTKVNQIELEAIWKDV